MQSYACPEGVQWVFLLDNGWALCSGGPQVREGCPVEPGEIKSICSLSFRGIDALALSSVAVMAQQCHSQWHPPLSQLQHYVYAALRVELIMSPQGLKSHC